MITPEISRKYEVLKKEKMFYEEANLLLGLGAKFENFEQNFEDKNNFSLSKVMAKCAQLRKRTMDSKNKNKIKKDT